MIEIVAIVLVVLVGVLVGRTVIVMIGQKKATAIEPLSEFRVRPKEAREAREVIRQANPALAMRLDTLFPVEECDHTWKKTQKAPAKGWGDYDYFCRGCGEQVWKAGNAWTTTEPKRLNARDMKRSGDKPLYLGSERDRPKSIVSRRDTRGMLPMYTRSPEIRVRENGEPRAFFDTKMNIYDQTITQFLKIGESEVEKRVLSRYTWENVYNTKYTHDGTWMVQDGICEPCATDYRDY